MGAMITRKPQKERLDVALVERKLSASREKARRAVMAGIVLVNGQCVTKPGQLVAPTDQLSVKEGEKYVSRGGLKLEHALKCFQLDAKDWIAVDLGASTGGFTDCLLQAGAAKVYAVDVGVGQLAWKLRQDSRVVVMEKTNARNLLKEAFPAGFEAPDAVVIDCSFISLRKILPSAITLCRPGSKIVALIKPQFEAGKAEADKGRGVITDPDIHNRILMELHHFCETLAGIVWHSVTESPLKGPAGNKEYFVLLEKTG